VIYFETAGDYGKFGYPMSSMTTVLAWGAIDYGAAYIQAGNSVSNATL